MQAHSLFFRVVDKQWEQPLATGWMLSQLRFRPRLRRGKSEVRALLPMHFMLGSLQP